MILLEAAALAILNGRQGWVRWLMIPLLLVHVGAVLVAEAFLVPEGDGGSYVWLLWGAQMLMAFVGLVLLFMPASNAWLRSPEAGLVVQLQGGEPGEDAFAAAHDHAAHVLP